MCLKSLYVQLYPHKNEKKYTTKGTTKISVKLPHQTDHMLDNREEGGMQLALPIEKQNGCASTNSAEEGLNGR